MRNVMKAAVLADKLPILSVEQSCIVSKDADITVCFKVELPELYTVTAEEYDAMHGVWIKAIKVLPNYTVVCKQDWFTEESYLPDFEDSSMTFLSRNFQKHFNERPFMNHVCYLFLTKTTKEHMRQQSSFNVLTRDFVVPKEIQDKDTVQKFLEAVDQFYCILNESGFIRAERILTHEIVGTDEISGILQKYLGLDQKCGGLDDIMLDPAEMRIGNKKMCLHTLSDPDDLPMLIKTNQRYERLSTDKSDTRLSFAAPVGVLLPCNHIYSQYIFIDDSEENLRNFEKSVKNLHSLSRYSRSNHVNQEWTEEYLNEAHTYGLTSVRCHCNVIAWSEDAAQLKQIKNEVGSQLALMECTPRHNTVDLPTLFWAGIPGNQADFPAEESFYTFLEQAVCLFNLETNYKDSPSPFGIKVVDRVTGKPIHLDITDLPMKKGITNNRNLFILGPSGSGKSFFTNHLVRQYWEQGTHILLVDTGNSYEGLCNLINSQTGGEDGVYYTYQESNPISFNPFYTSDNVFDIEKRESIKTLLLTLWKRDDETPTRSEEVALSNAVSLFIKKLQQDSSIIPSFNTFYEFVKDDYLRILAEKHVREKDFDAANFLNVLEPYYKGGEYDYLLNSTSELDLLNKRFIVFEIDSISEHKILFPVVTIIIMEVFLGKMRRLKGIRKMMVVEEAWKAIAKEGMANYLKYLFKTVRKFYGSIAVVTQEVSDIVSSEIVKDTIINNADCKILLDQRKYMNRFDDIQKLLGLTDKEKAQILSINLSNNASRKYKEVWIGLGGTVSNCYAIEVSKSEYYCYTTEESEKVQVLKLAEELGSYELAIKAMVARENEQNTK